MWLVVLYFAAYALVQVLKIKPMLWSFILQNESSDTEHFVDINEAAALDTSTTAHSDKEGGVEEDESAAETGGGGGGGDGDGETVLQPLAYKLAARNPLYCGAETSCLWELARVRPSRHTCSELISLLLCLQMSAHFHPSVQVFAKTIASVSQNLCELPTCFHLETKVQCVCLLFLLVLGGREGKGSTVINLTPPIISGQPH